MEVLKSSSMPFSFVIINERIVETLGSPVVYWKCKEDEKQFQCIYLSLHQVFQISKAKMKEGIFVCPQIRQALKHPNFEKMLLTSFEQCAWKAFEWLCRNFSAYTILPLLQQGVENLLKALKN